MILPIVAYGDPVLKKEAEEINENYPELDKLLANMFETMDNAEGVGLAAPQIGLGIRLFLVDASGMVDDEDIEKAKTEERKEELRYMQNFRRVFINPIMVEETGKRWDYEEGCLSIPGIREKVSRHPDITLEYYDENWELWEEEFTGIAARIIQHEYDHIEGVLFTDKLSPIRKQFLKGKLNDISKGLVPSQYKMKFPNRK